MRSTIAEIKISNLIHNYNQFKLHSPKTEIMPVVKADAYGHGIIEITKRLRAVDAELIAVAFADEAMILRNNGDTGDLFVLIPGTKEDCELYVAYNLQASVMDIEIAKRLSDLAVKRATKVRGHLFINSGMNRDGIEPKDAINFMNECSKMEGLEIIGLMTHLASSELEDRTFANKQIDIFNKTLESLKNNNYNFKKIHAFNSAGVLNFENDNFNFARCGIGLYGYMDYKYLADKLDLKPILTLKSRVININNISSGDSVGYSLKYISDEKKKIAVVPLGYGDGYPRTLSGKAQCLINGKRYNLVGTICMDQSLIDIGNDEIKIGDEVIYIGKQGDEEITAYELASLNGSIPYEITTALKSRVPRVYIE